MQSGTCVVCSRSVWCSRGHFTVVVPVVKHIFIAGLLCHCDPCQGGPATNTNETCVAGEGRKCFAAYTVSESGRERRFFGCAFETFAYCWSGCVVNKRQKGQHEHLCFGLFCLRSAAPRHKALNVGASLCVGLSSRKGREAAT